MLGFDYFQLLDLLTIARSRKHIQKYYGTQETGEFPERLKPINRKPDVDLTGEFPAIRDINNEIRRLHLSAYAPLRYVLPHKQAAYDAKYSQRVKGGTGLFRQLDREESLIHLLRVNVLKRMESSVHSFALTVGRQLADVEDTLKKISDRTGEAEEIDIDEFEPRRPSCREPRRGPCSQGAPPGRRRGPVATGPLRRPRPPSQATGFRKQGVRGARR